MPSPFPGMDPYLEDRVIWPDFHNRLASEISVELNRVLPGHYYARLEARPELGIVEAEEEVSRRIVPDVSVVHEPRHAIGPEVAVLDRPRRQVSRSVEVEVPAESVRHPFIEVRESGRDRKLITLIEILSPSNKRPGPDRSAYAAKQRDVLLSDANLVELDLLRAGDRILPSPALGAWLAGLEPASDYVVLVSRAWRRVEPSWGYSVFPIGLREWLPCVGVPLKQEEDEVLLDLQFVFNRAYDGGPYLRGAVDYARPPTPPLSCGDAEWAAALLGERGLAAPPPA